MLAATPVGPQQQAAPGEAALATQQAFVAEEAAAAAGAAAGNSMSSAEQLQALLVVASSAGAQEQQQQHGTAEHQHQRASSTGGAPVDPATGVKPPFLYRLFVGWVPKHYVEKDLTPYFAKYGQVKDIIVLKDKVTHAPRGCAFVSYATKEEAELAISNLDRKVQLPGALSLLEVRFAKSHQYVQAGTGPNDNRQLFFTAAPMHLGEQEISQIFSQFGVVEEVNLFRDRKSGNSKGCGFISFQTRAQACAAMDALEHKSAEPSEEMSVQWADPELQFKKKRALEESNADNRMLFFAKVLRSANEEDVKRLFSRFGKVYDINLFRAFQGAPTTKGCGLVTMGTHEEARAAIEGLDSRFCWEGMDSPMVVKWMDAALQRRRREQHLANMLGMTQGMPQGLGASGDPWLTQHTAMQIAGMGGPGGGMLARGVGVAPALLMPQQEQEVEEVPPVGCQSDTFKLFVGNIPKACTEDQLLPFFESVGKVAELVIVRDKAQQSKGSAFVWYVQRAHAERAILQFNLRHVLPDPTGEQDRPLVVRRARSRTNKPAMPLGMPGMALGGLGGGHGMGMGGVGAGSSMGMVMQAAGGQGKPSQGLALSLSGMQGGLSHGQQHPALALVAGHSHGLQGLSQGATFYAAAGHSSGNAGKLQGLGGLDQSSLSSQALALQHAALGGGYMPLQQGVSYVTTAAGGATVMHPHAAMAVHHAQQGQVPGGAQLVSIQAAPAVSETGLYEAYGTPGDRGMMDRYVLTAAGPSSADMGSAGTPGAGGDNGMQGGGGGGPLALSLQLNLQQLGLVNAHLYSIQSMSGAQVNVSPGAHGLFHLLVSGSKGQVDAARSLLSQVLGLAV